ncbi:hypothetical protein ACGFYV_34845 [Streptomyces sp. NPDC048297]|uniref:hypothetical protein n=1 Tax=Streptomyces sp. NPDC048297 TaxID=3365531 RepID=UPI0037102949
MPAVRAVNWASKARPFEGHGRGPDVVVVPLDRDTEWEARLRRASCLDLVFRGWEQAVSGDHPAGVRSPVLLLDSGGARPLGELVACVRSLKIVTPVVVSAEGAENASRLLMAGALNVLDRNAPPGVLMARIEADLRWLRRTGAVGDRRCATGAPRLAVQAPAFRTQALLLDVLCSLRGPVCCHDIRMLLGTPAQPMTLRALRARIERLEPYLTRHGVRCLRSVRYGADTIDVEALLDTAELAGQHR